MQLYSQIDPRWGRTTIGYTPFRIEKWGCTLTSLCMLLTKFYPELVYLPSEAAKEWVYDEQAKIVWTKSKFPGIKFVYRDFGYNKSKVVEFATNSGKGVLLEVNGNHWVAVEGMENGKYIICDPLDGKIYHGLPSKYQITGSARFEMTEFLIPDWSEDFCQKATNEKNNLPSKDLKEKMTIKMMLDDLVILQKIKDAPEDCPRYLWYVILGKTGLLN